MKAHLIKIGNSQGILINKTFLEQYRFDTMVDIEPQTNGLLIKPIKNNPRQHWESQFEAAIANGQLPEESGLLDGFSNDFDSNGDWTW